MLFVSKAELFVFPVEDRLSQTKPNQWRVLGKARLFKNRRALPSTLIFKYSTGFGAGCERRTYFLHLLPFPVHGVPKRQRAQGGGVGGVG